MMVPENFDSSIEKLLNAKNKDTVFLSSWNIADEYTQLADLNEIIRNSMKDQNAYFFMDEFEEYKKRFIFNNKLKIKPHNMAIGSNGTIISSLTLHVLSRKKQLNVLVLTPVYYTYLEVLRDLNVNIFYQKIISDDSLVFNDNIEAIKSIIEKNNINLIIINDPIFGTGIKLPIYFFESLLKICSIDTTILIDYIYGGMDWNKTSTIINHSLINLINTHPNVIILDSLAKKVFLNGLKSGTLFGHPSLIKEVERYSVYLCGSISFPQMTIFDEIHLPKNEKIIQKKISQSVTTAIDNFELIQTVLNGSDFIISPCNSGYYCLLGVPKKHKNNDDSIAEKILINLNVLTIPHERYLFSSDNYYCFRINLLLSKDNLLSTIKKLLDFHFYNIN